MDDCVLPALDDKWPPVKECAQYRYGMIQPYLRRFEWEKKEHLDDSAYYTSSDEEDDYKVKNVHQLVKRFLQQVRDSRGYDVDCMPPARFDSPFRKVKLPAELEYHKVFRSEVNRAIHFAVDKIKERTGKTYELVEIEKLVETDNFMFLFTFNAKEVVSDPDADAAVRTFHAMVYTPLFKDCELEELRLKPKTAAPSDI